MVFIQHTDLFRIWNIFNKFVLQWLIYDLSDGIESKHLIPFVQTRTLYEETLGEIGTNTILHEIYCLLEYKCCLKFRWSFLIKCSFRNKYFPDIINIRDRHYCYTTYYRFAKSKRKRSCMCVHIWTYFNFWTFLHKPNNTTLSLKNNLVIGQLLPPY